MTCPASTRRLTAAWAALCFVLAAALVFAAEPAFASGQDGPRDPGLVLTVTPTGSGSKCTAKKPCSLAAAQDVVRSTLETSRDKDITVELGNGTYRQTTPLRFGAADSGTKDHPVVWTAAPGARPIISGAARVTGWRETDPGKGIWAAPVPAGTNTRQVDVNGAEAPVAQASPATLGFGRWASSGGSVNISADPKAQAFFGGLTPAQLHQVEFVWPGGNGAWTQSSCPLASATASTVTLTEPCWDNSANRPAWDDATGGLPALSSAYPTIIRNAYAALQPGQWYLDSGTNTLYYEPTAGQRMTQLDVEVPRLQSLLQGTGTLANPVHDLTFSGIQFSGATWTDPSTNVGFSDVQDNLRITAASSNQGMCGYDQPSHNGSCPWYSLTQPMANVQFIAADRITLTGDTFRELGGTGVGFRYGSSDNLIEGNIFTDIASSALTLGCTYDPDPGNTAPGRQQDPDSAITTNCGQGTDQPNPASAHDTIGTNEVMTGNTVTQNLIHHIGTDYPSAAGITQLFTRHTTITHNEIFDTPYDGITDGVVQGHVDNGAHPDDSLNINEYNTISDNLMHDVMQTLSDGGPVYIEGHQGQYVRNADGTINSTASLATGLQLTGNVAYNGHHSNHAYYDDAGASWIAVHGNVDWNGFSESVGGCDPVGHFWISGNWVDASVGNSDCETKPIDVNVGTNTKITTTPGPADLPLDGLAEAGLTGQYRALGLSATPTVYYSHASGSTVLIADEGLGARTTVCVGGVVVHPRFLSAGFALATVPPGANGTAVTVTNCGDTSGTTGAY